MSFHFPSGRVIFAHHERTSDIIAGDIEILSGDIGRFLNDFLHDRLTEKLDELDRDIDGSPRAAANSAVALWL